MRNFLYIMLVVLLFVSCRSGIDTTKGTPLARVGDEYLYETDLKGLLPSNISLEDSIVWVKNYVNNWVRTKLLIEKAKQNLKPEQLDFKRQLEKYKNSLIIYEYQTEFIKQNLDTTVTSEEIEQYYREHKNDFLLLKNIVRVMYVVMDKDKKLEKKFKSLFALPDSVILDSLEVNSKLYARDYFLDTAVWIPFDDLLKEVPLEVYNKELFLENNKFIKLKTKEEIYMVKLIDFKIKNDVSPLVMEEENIKNIIINKRKIDIVKDMRDKLYKNALQKDKIEIYTYE